MTPTPWKAGDEGWIKFKVGHVYPNGNFFINPDGLHEILVSPDELSAALPAPAVGLSRKWLIDVIRDCTFAPDAADMILEKLTELSLRAPGREGEDAAAISDTSVAVAHWKARALKAEADLAALSLLDAEKAGALEETSFIAGYQAAYHRTGSGHTLARRAKIRELALEDFASSALQPKPISRGDFSSVAAEPLPVVSPADREPAKGEG